MACDDVNIEGIEVVWPELVLCVVTDVVGKVVVWLVAVVCVVVSRSELVI